MYFFSFSGAIFFNELIMRKEKNQRYYLGRDGILVLVLLCLFVSVSSSQNEASNWIFGQAWVDFSGENIEVKSNGKNFNNEGLSAISDCGGRLLFYSDSENIYARTGEVMLNGSNIGGHYSSTQGALIIPHPGDCYLFYVFTVDAKESGFQGGLKYSMVDMRGDNGFGNVIEKGKTLLPGVSEKLTAVYHADGQSVWVVVHEMGTNIFHSFLVTENGIEPVSIKSAAGIPFVTVAQGVGQMKISPDGRKLALVTLNLKMLQLFDYDSSTGKVTNERIIDGDVFERPGLYGVEFSPSGRYVYVSNHIADWILNAGFIYQLDTEAGDEEAIMASATIVGENALVTEMRGLQLGHDGRIYVTRSSTAYLGVIESPDLPGLACNYIDQGLSLDGYKVFWSLPNFLVSWFDPKRKIAVPPSIIVEGRCVGEPLHFFSEGLKPDAFDTWDFGDGKLSAAINGTHTYQESGDYQVSLIYHEECCRDTIRYWVSIDSCQLDISADIYIPNAFSPNGDGVNDKLWVYGDGLESFFWQIFDRWGNLVFESTNQAVGWDGRKKGRDLPVDTYIYSLIINTQGQENVVLRGNVFLRR